MKNKLMLLCLCMSLGLPMTSTGQTVNCKPLCSAGTFKCAYPRWSKDGKKILYQCDSSGKWKLMEMDIEKKTHKVLVGDSGNNYFADLSADNSWICFVSDRNGNEDLYLAKSDGSSVKCIIRDSARDIHPYFSPDGKYILFNSTRGNGSLDIYRYTISDGSIARLTDTPEDETCSRFAPDMKHIVYLKNSRREDDVYVLDLSNFLSTNISRTPDVHDGWPVYSPSGRWIYYSSMSSGAYSIFQSPSDGKWTTRLTTGKTGHEHTRASISPDGRRILYNIDTDKGIYMEVCDLQ